MSQPRTFFYDDANTQAEILSEELAISLRNDVQAHGKALLVLPGGSSPCALISKIAKKDLPWDSIDITLTDERCVPLDSEHSNAGQITRLCAAQGLSVSPVILWDEHIADVSALSWPASVTVLGMGLDGHIASLFPQQNWFSDDEIIIESKAPSEPSRRLSLTMDVLVSSSNLILLVNGHEKWALYQRALNGQEAGTPLSELINIAGDKLQVHIVDS